MMSASRSDFHAVNRSSSGMYDTNPPVSPRRSIVATSMADPRLSRNAPMAWHASWIATACRSRSMYSKSSGRPWSFWCFAFKTSGQVTASRPSRIALTSASLTVSLMVAPVAYGDVTASCSTSSSVRTFLTRLRYPSKVRFRPSFDG